MGLDKRFVEKAFASGKDRVNRAIFVKPEELIELSDEDLSYFGEGIFYCLLGTFLKMRSWDRIRKTKPSLKEIINMVEKWNSGYLFEGVFTPFNFG